uniref:GCS light chain n=1 Tax=Acrobeloides nanus TaxID=290746 RepID=A0A914CEI6_9BILA
MSAKQHSCSMSKIDIQFKNFKKFRENEFDSDIYITDRSSDTKFNRAQHKITLKIFLENFEPLYVREAVDATLKELNTDFIEQIILAFPQSFRNDENRDHKKWSEQVLSVWKEAEKLVKDRMAMVIGVADFNKEEMELLYDKAEILPRIDQIRNTPHGLKEFAETNDIQLLSHNDPIPFPVKEVFKEVCQTNPCLPACGPCFNPRWTARYAIWAELWLVLESKGYIVKFDNCETLSGSVP